MGIVHLKPALHTYHICAAAALAGRVQVENPEYTADALRHVPLGEDSRGCRYYYFSTNNEDCRLYRCGALCMLPGCACRMRHGWGSAQGHCWMTPTLAGQRVCVVVAAAACARAQATPHLSTSGREDWPKFPKSRRVADDAPYAAWATECTTLEELQDFSQRMGNSRNKDERALHELLEEQVSRRPGRGGGGVRA